MFVFLQLKLQSSPTNSMSLGTDTVKLPKKSTLINRESKNCLDKTRLLAIKFVELRRIFVYQRALLASYKVSSRQFVDNSMNLKSDSMSMMLHSKD